MMITMATSRQAMGELGMVSGEKNKPNKQEIKAFG